MCKIPQNTRTILIERWRKKGLFEDHFTPGRAQCAKGFCSETRLVNSLLFIALSQAGLKKGAFDM